MLSYQFSAVFKDVHTELYKFKLEVVIRQTFTYVQPCRYLVQGQVHEYFFGHRRWQDQVGLKKFEFE